MNIYARMGKADILVITRFPNIGKAAGFCGFEQDNGNLLRQYVTIRQRSTLSLLCGGSNENIKITYSYINASERLHLLLADV